MEVEIKRGMTINVGDFSNVQPSVSIRFNVDDKLDEKYMNASNILDELFKLEVSTLACEYNDIREKGKNVYSEETIENYKEGLKIIKDNFKELRE